MGTGSGGVSVRAGPSPRLDGRRALLRHARRGVLRSQARGETEIEHEEPLAALLCGECGQLDWTETASGTAPHRRDADPTMAGSASCAHCGASSWIRVGRAEMAESLRAFEHQDQRWFGRVLRHTLVGTATGAGLGLLVAAGWSVALVAGLAGLATGLLAYREHRKWSPVRRALPARWMMALPPAAEIEGGVKGRIVADELRRAPLTGRACVAYEVGITVSDPPSSNLEDWLLLEQHVFAATVQGSAVEPSRTHLELARERIGTVAEVSRDDAARTYLLQRGFGRESDGLQVFESIVEPDAEVSLERTAEGDRLRVDAARAAC